MIFIIWGKESCPQCDAAKAVLDKAGMGYFYKVLGEDYTREELIDKVPGARQVPQIFEITENAEVYVGDSAAKLKSYIVDAI